MSHRSPSQQRSRLEYKHEFKTITQAHKDNTLVNYETAGVHDWVWFVVCILPKPCCHDDEILELQQETHW